MASSLAAAAESFLRTRTAAVSSTSSTSSSVLRAASAATGAAPFSSSSGDDANNAATSAEAALGTRRSARAPHAFAAVGRRPPASSHWSVVAQPSSSLSSSSTMAEALTSSSFSAFSTATSPTDEQLAEQQLGPRSLPTRHSRNLPPPVAPPSLVDSLTDDFVSAPLGSLLPYDPDWAKLSPEDEAIQLHESKDVLAQKVEYVLRGHAALLPGTIVARRIEKMSGAGAETTTDDNDNDKKKSVQERIDAMRSILRRVEEEGDAYVKVRTKLRSQIAAVGVGQAAGDVDDGDDDEESSSSSSGSSSDEDQDDDDAWSSHHSGANAVTGIGAPPGPTVVMYDLFLDVLACHPTPTAPAESKSILDAVLHRHQLNGGIVDVDVDTVPTSLTFNAVVRCAANCPYDDDSDGGSSTSSSERIRDEAIDAAFSTYDRMHRTRYVPAVSRNAATYAYLLRTVGKFLPPSKSRGNISLGIWDKAKNERVVDENVIDAVRYANERGGSNGPDYERWLDGEVRIVSNVKEDVEHKWMWNYRSRRYDRNDPTY